MNAPSYPASISAPANTATPAVQFQATQGPGLPSPTLRGRPRGAAPPGAGLGTGAKRGRKQRTGSVATGSPMSAPQDLGATSGSAVVSQPASVQWASSVGSTFGAGVASLLQGNLGAAAAAGGGGVSSTREQTGTAPGTGGVSASASTEQRAAGSGLATSSFISLPGVVAPVMAAAGGSSGVGNRMSGLRAVADEDGEGEDELLPAMADDDYSAQLSWQSQSKDNLKVLMENLSPAQYERFEAYRRHALPKQAVRKVIQQSLGQQVSQPVAQIVAGFAKVFVGEIVEKARGVQTRRKEHGPLSPDHLREAYRMYQEETGRVGAARPLRSRRMFVR